MKNHKPNIQLLQDLEEYVSGHIEAKKALINLVNRSKVRHRQKFELGMYPEYLLSPSKILLIGASGTGKTHLVESLNKIVTFPLIKIDATELNPTGASGGIKVKDLKEMIVDEAKAWVANQKYSGAEFHSLEGTVDQTVVFIDEIDKLGQSFDSSGHWNKHVQSNFLTMFDNKDEYAGISFIFAGAFSSITGEDHVPQKQFGFHKTKDDRIDRDLDTLAVKAGMIPELVGRLTHICELDKFTIEDYHTILKTRLFPKKQMDLAALDIFNIELSEERGRQMAEKAYKSGQGVRALQRELEKEFIDAEFNFEDDRENYFLEYEDL